MDDDFDDWDDDVDCSWCGGEGFDENDDPIQLVDHFVGEDGTGYRWCGACGGTGLAKDQIAW